MDPVSCHQGRSNPTRMYNKEENIDLSLDEEYLKSSFEEIDISGVPITAQIQVDKFEEAEDPEPDLNNKLDPLSLPSLPSLLHIRAESNKGKSVDVQESSEILEKNSSVLNYNIEQNFHFGIPNILSRESLNAGLRSLQYTDDSSNLEVGYLFSNNEPSDSPIQSSSLNISAKNNEKTSIGQSQETSEISLQSNSIEVLNNSVGQNSHLADITNIFSRSSNTPFSCLQYTDDLSNLENYLFLGNEPLDSPSQFPPFKTSAKNNEETSIQSQESSETPLQSNSVEEPELLRDEATVSLEPFQLTPIRRKSSSSLHHSKTTELSKKKIISKIENDQFKFFMESDESDTDTLQDDKALVDYHESQKEYTEAENRKRRFSLDSSDDKEYVTPRKCAKTLNSSASENEDESEYAPSNSDHANVTSDDESESDYSTSDKHKTKNKIKHKTKAKIKSKTKHNDKTKYKNKSNCKETKCKRKPALPSLDDSQPNCNTKPTITQRSMSFDQKIDVSSAGGKWYYKQNFCIYCLTFQNRIDRHLLSKHLDVKEVLAISLLKPKSKLRKEKLGAIRREGNDYFNNDKTLNPEGKIICARRNRVKKKSDDNEENDNTNQPNLNMNDANENLETMKNKVLLPSRMICPYCKGYFHSKNLHNHIRLSHNNKKCFTSNKNVINASKREMGLCHERASDQVRNLVLPKLRLDPFGTAARYDKLIILYANKFIIRYSSVDQQAYVRGHMRLLGKLLVSLKSINKDVKELSTVFDPVHWPTVLEAINLVSEHDSTTNRFSIIYNAETIPILLRKCIKILKNEYTITRNSDGITNLIDFERVFEDEVEFQVCYKANLSRKELSRHQSEKKIPASQDVFTFKNYLQIKRAESLKHFETGGREYSHWLNVLQTTAVLLLLYNRRRVGEISKTLLLDYLNAKQANPDSEFFKLLPENEQKQRLKYKRIDIQGKRYDGQGSLYVSEDNEKALKLTIKYRSLYGIRNSNPFLFAIPAGVKEPDNHIKICDLMSRLSKECSIKFKEIEDETLRGTLLRKQLATYNSTVDHGKNKHLITKHMGHSDKIHDKHYKRTVDGDDVAITHVLDSADNPIASSSKQTISKIVESDSSSESFSESDNAIDQPVDEIIPKKKIVRRSWSTEEVTSFEEGFKKFLKKREYPSATIIRSVQSKYPILKNRTEKVIRTRFSNIYKNNA